jgi:hypothetical protein
LFTEWATPPHEFADHGGGALNRHEPQRRNHMPTSGLNGPYPLTDDDINKNVTRTSPGAYALGYSANGSFYIDYVGRSDGDVNKRLHDHVGKYRQFKFDYFGSAKAAFQKECHLYHDFTPKDNKAHPARPTNSGWSCPVCTIFD